MSRHRRRANPQSERVWDTIYRAHRAGATTIEELCLRSGYSKTVVYDRLREAAERAAEPTADFVVLNRSSAEPGPEAGATEADLDDGVYCVITDDIRDVVRPSRNYANDPIHGEECYVMRDHYLVATRPEHLAGDRGKLADTTTVDVRGGLILTTRRSGRGLKRSRLGSGDHVRDPGGPTKHEADPDGLAGGTGKPIVATGTDPKHPRLKNYHINGLTIQALNKSDARAEAKRQRRADAPSSSSSSSPRCRKRNTGGNGHRNGNSNGNGKASSRAS